LDSYLHWFCWGLIILRPTSSIFDPKALLPLIAAFVLGLYQIITKKGF
jgi:hypothetical protein